MSKTTVSYGRTISANYQAKRADFGFETVATDGSAVARAYRLCKAVVDNQLGEKTGLKLSEANALATEFFNVGWNELATGTKPGDSAV